MKLSLPITVLIASGALVAAGWAVAGTSDAQETAMFGRAQVDIQQAVSIAMDGLDGNVSSIEFANENGRAIWEAVAIAADGSLSEIVIDASDGTAIAQGAYMGDEEEEDDRG